MTHGDITEEVVVVQWFHGVMVNTLDSESSNPQILLELYLSWESVMEVVLLNLFCPTRILSFRDQIGHGVSHWLFCRNKQNSCSSSQS